MKKLLMSTVALVLVGGYAHAHTTKDVKKASDPALEAVLKTAGPLVKLNSPTVVVRAYQITEFSPPAAKKETSEALYTRTVKALLHRDFPITGDDGGYTLKPVTGKIKASDVPFIDQLNTDDPKAGETTGAFVDALDQAQEKGLVVLFGDGSGNNTAAEIVVIVDPANSELIYVMASNFGSDN